MQPTLFDEASFSTFFAEHYPTLVLYTNRFTNDPMIAEDIAEDAFVALWNRRETLAKIRSPKFYLYRIARNASLSWIRKNKRETVRHEKAALLSDDFERTSLENMIHAETMAKIYATLNRLPTQCRKVFVMHYIEGKKLTEIAQILGIAVGTVKTHKVRGIQILQKSMVDFIALMILIRF